MAMLLLVLFMLFALLFYFVHTWQRQAIDRQAHAQAEAVAHTMVTSLQTLMLSGDAENIRDWLARMRIYPDLQSVNVLRRNGDLAFRDLKTIHQVNHFLGGSLFSRDALPRLQIKAVSDADLARAVHGEEVVLRDDAANRLTIVEPINMEQTCLQCHGYEDNPVRGMLFVTTSTANARAAMWRVDRNLLLMVGLGLFLISLLIVLMHRYMETIIDALGGMLFVTDREGIIRMANQQACCTLGYADHQQLLGKKMLALLVFGQEGIDFSQKCDDKEVLLQDQSGQHVPVSMFSAKMPMCSWLERADMVHVLRDLSQQKESERKIRLAATVMDTVSSAIMVEDHHARIRLINPAFTTITGYSADEALGENPNILRSGRQSTEFYTEMWNRIRETGGWSGELWNRRKNGELYPEWLIINTMQDEHGEVSYYVSTFLDISVQKKMEDQLRHSARHDLLTGLPNRMLLYDRLNCSLSRAHRNASKVGVLFVDIDGFKLVNDTHGHDVGDDLLQQISVRLRGCVRDSDTVARVGGDEFVLVLESNSEQSILLVANKVLLAIQETFILAAARCQVGASIGIALYPDGGDDSEVLLKQSDTAMYVAKKGGKNRAVVFNQAEMRGDVSAQ